MLLSVNEHDLSFGFDKISNLLFKKAFLEHEVHFKVPPAGAAEALRTANSKELSQEVRVRARSHAPQDGRDVWHQVHQARGSIDNDLDAVTPNVSILKQIKKSRITKLFDV